MPTYDYECSGCGHRFELFQSMTAPVKRTCPECKKKTLERLIGPGAGFLFKGDGFYITDYRSEKYKSDAKSADKAPDRAPDRAPEKAQDARASETRSADAKDGSSKPEKAKSTAADTAPKKAAGKGKADK